MLGGRHFPGCGPCPIVREPGRPAAGRWPALPPGGRHWKKMSRPPSSGRRKPEPLGFEIGDHAARLFASRRLGSGFLPLSPEACEGRLLLSPTALLDQRQVGFAPVRGGGSVGILRPGLRFRASSNNRFCFAFKISSRMSMPALRSGRRGLLPTGTLLLGGGLRSLFFRLPITMLVTNFFSPWSSNLMTMRFVAAGHHRSQAEPLVFDLSALREGV